MSQFKLVKYSDVTNMVIEHEDQHIINVLLKCLYGIIPGKVRLTYENNNKTYNFKMSGLEFLLTRKLDDEKRYQIPLTIYNEQYTDVICKKLVKRLKLLPIDLKYIELKIYINNKIYFEGSAIGFIEKVESE